MPETKTTRSSTNNPATRLSAAKSALIGLDTAVKNGIIASEYASDIPVATLQLAIDTAELAQVTYDGEAQRVKEGLVSKRNDIAMREKMVREKSVQAEETAMEQWRKESTESLSRRSIAIATAKREKKVSFDGFASERLALNETKKSLAAKQVAAKSAQSTLATLLRRLDGLLTLAFPNAKEKNLRNAVKSGATATILELGKGK